MEFLLNYLMKWDCSEVVGLCECVTEDVQDWDKSLEKRSAEDGIRHRHLFDPNG